MYKFNPVLSVVFLIVVTFSAMALSIATGVQMFLIFGMVLVGQLVVAIARTVYIMPKIWKLEETFPEIDSDYLTGQWWQDYKACFSSIGGKVSYDKHKIAADNRCESAQLRSKLVNAWVAVQAVTYVAIPFIWTTAEALTIITPETFSANDIFVAVIGVLIVSLALMAIEFSVRNQRGKIEEYQKIAEYHRRLTDGALEHIHGNGSVFRAISE